MSVSTGVSNETYASRFCMDLPHRRLTPEFTFIYYVSGGGMNCVSCDICVPPWVVCVFPWGIPLLQSDWSLSCDHGLDYASKCI